MLDDIKTLLEITDTSKDNLLNIYIRKSTTAIKNYLNNDNFDDTYVQLNFQDAITEMVVDSYSISQKIKNRRGIKQDTQGPRTTVYKDDTQTFLINDTIKNLLPRPYLKLR